MKKIINTVGLPIIFICCASIILSICLFLALTTLPFDPCSTQKWPVPILALTNISFILIEAGLSTLYLLYGLVRLVLVVLRRKKNKDSDRKILARGILGILFSILLLVGMSFVLSFEELCPLNQFIPPAHSGSSIEKLIVPTSNVQTFEKSLPEGDKVAGITPPKD